MKTSAVIFVQPKKVVFDEVSIPDPTARDIVAAAEPTATGSTPAELDRYNVVWTSPGKDDSGSMPMGNGQLGINLWVEENGDLHFYLSRNDSLSEVSRLLKVGAVRVALSPNPFATGASFRQELLLRDGVCEITAGQGAGLVKLRVFVDVEKPVVHVCGESTSPVSVTVSCDSWRKNSHSIVEGEEHKSAGKQEQNSSWTLMNAPFDLVESADVFPDTGKDSLAWYHRNETSTAVDSTIELQSLQSIAGTISNPLLHLTFGGWIVAEGLRRSGTGASATLSSPAPLTKFGLRVAAPCQQTPKAQDWLDLAEKIATSETDAGSAENRTKEWWNAFWNRSWVLAENTHAGCTQPGHDNDASEDNKVDLLTRGYLLQRYVQACAAGGPYPIKFNGSLFTVSPQPMGLPYTPDWRRWGDCFWWQNTRLPYHPMLASGDFEMMQPLFDFYSSVAPMCEARAKLYHGVSGCYFPETMTHWGTYANEDYGWNRTGRQPNDVASKWWRYVWIQGLELVALMLDRWDYTGDTVSLKDQTLPMAESVLRYFDTRFKRNANGRLIISPTQSAETYWSDVTDDLPTVAGLIDITTRLCGLPESSTTAEQREFFARMRKVCPDVPVEEGSLQGNVVRKLAPAAQYTPHRTNVENPELYAIWPFRLYGLDKPGLDEARAAYGLRHEYLDVGWGYDGNCAALLGMTDEAARILLVKTQSNPHYRWHATWGPNFDWLPDQDHGSNLLITTQLMLLQADGDKIRLLPAWPRNWDVSFKLHAPGMTTVECVYRNGKVEHLTVTPESRRQDIIFGQDAK